MKPEKSILINIILVCVITLIGWFFVVAPYAKVQELTKIVPTWVNSNLITYYPEDLIITVKKGIVSLNKPSPYCLTFPLKNKTDGKLDSGLVFDVYSTADISALQENGKYSKLCQPIALIGKDFVIYPDKENTYKYTKISDTVDLDINRNSIKKFVDQYLPLVVSFGQKAYFIIPFALLPIVFVAILSSTLWYASVVKFVCKIFKIRIITFEESFKLSLFFFNFILFTEWVLINFILDNLLHQKIDLSFLFRNTFLITIASVFYLQKTPAPPEKKVPTTPIAQVISTTIPTGQ